VASSAALIGFYVLGFDFEAVMVSRQQNARQLTMRQLHFFKACLQVLY